MVFIESKIFSRYLPEYLGDDEYRMMQIHLAAAPASGALIKGTGGIRKLRWAGSGRGKRGGVRVIYYWQAADNEIYLLTLYAKGEASDLTADEKKILKRMVESW